MKIFRTPRPDRGFTQIDNRVLRDHRLSYRARGLLAELLSYPDNWEIDIARLSRQSEAVEGREALRTAMGELQEVGYVVRTRNQDPTNGQWSTRTEVYDVPLSGWPDDHPPGGGGTPSPDARKPVVGVTSGNGTKPQVSPTPENPSIGAPDVGSPGANKKTKKEDQEELTSSLRSEAPRSDKIDDVPSPKEDRKPRSSTRGTRLPENWKPSPDLVAWTLSQGLTRDEARRENEKFCDHWKSQPGQKGVKVDWDATWRNWVRRYVDQRTKPAAAFARKSGRQTDEEFDASIARDLARAKGGDSASAYQQTSILLALEGGRTA